MTENGNVRRASYISLAVSIALLIAKFWAYRMTLSQAIFSDAMESIVNVSAASLTLLVVAFSRKPADRDHPYGHGKVEFFSAAFEGGLIAFASVLICYQAIQALIEGQAPMQLGLGLAVTLSAGGVNALLGVYLIRTGRFSHSSAIEASGYHMLSDFWTSIGVTIGLVLVALTGQSWMDPATALIMGIFLGRVGFKPVRRSIGGLLDEEDREILGNLQKLVGKRRPEGIIQLHHVRVMRAGHFHHIDAHAVVPEFWDIAEAHKRTSDFEQQLMEDYSSPGELHLHVDPCRRAYCRVCDVHACPIRQYPFEHQRQLSIDEMTSPDEPPQFKAARKED